MNRMKRFALNVVVMIGMTLAMSSLGLAQQETIPDQFLGADEIRAAQPVAPHKDKGKVQMANSHRQAKTRNHKRLAKQTASDNQTVALARK
jgi:hypothetical protein